MKQQNNLGLVSQVDHSTRFINSTASFESVCTRLGNLAAIPQWILITSEYPRPALNHLTHAYQNISHKTVQLKASRFMNEYQVVMKAIRSGNACAVIASDQFTSQQQKQLSQLARRYHCEVFFAEVSLHSLH